MSMENSNDRTEFLRSFQDQPIITLVNVGRKEGTITVILHDDFIAQRFPGTPKEQLTETNYMQMLKTIFPIA